MPTPFITIFTPTYNRRPYLGFLYESIKKQGFDAFEWIIVDDGSTDDTQSEVETFIAEGRITICYHRQENSGKHVAINRGVEMAKGELFFIVDSDDTLANGALSAIVAQWKDVLKLPNISNYAGLCGTRIYKNGSVIGGDIDYTKLDVSAIEYRFAMGYQGDRSEVILTRIMRQYPYPNVPGERFCADAVVWNRIAQSYLLRFFDQPLIVCEYLLGGITDTSVKLRKESPKCACLYYAEMRYLPGLTALQRLKAIINFWRFAVYDTKSSFSDKHQMIGSFWSYLLYPAARILKMLKP